jgi:hypothetical protein
MWIAQIVVVSIASLELTGSWASLQKKPRRKAAAFWDMPTILFIA